MRSLIPSSLALCLSVKHNEDILKFCLANSGGSSGWAVCKCSMVAMGEAISRAAQTGVRGESSLSPVASLCREVGGCGCISILCSFSWELKTRCAGAPMRCSLWLHRARTALDLKLIAQKLASGVVLDWFLIPSCSEQSCSASAQLQIDAASQHGARAAVLCLP